MAHNPNLYNVHRFRLTQESLHYIRRTVHKNCVIWIGVEQVGMLWKSFSISFYPFVYRRHLQKYQIEIECDKTRYIPSS